MASKDSSDVGGSIGFIHSDALLFLDVLTDAGVITELLRWLAWKASLIVKKTALGDTAGFIGPVSKTA